MSLASNNLGFLEIWVVCCAVNPSINLFCDGGPDSCRRKKDSVESCQKKELDLGIEAERRNRDHTGQSERGVRGRISRVAQQAQDHKKIEPREGGSLANYARHRRLSGLVAEEVKYPRRGGQPRQSETQSKLLPQEGAGDCDRFRGSYGLVTCCCSKIQC